MYKNDCSQFWQNYIWGSWKILSVQTEPVSESVQRRPNFSLRLGVFAANSPHVPASLLDRMDVCHAPVAARSEVCSVPNSSKSCRARMWGTMVRASSSITGTITLFPNCL